MKNRFYSALIVLALVTDPVAPPDHSVQPLQEGKAAFKKAEYERANKLLNPLADAGNPEAQYLMGRMYHAGLGVQKDLLIAKKYYVRAGKQDYAPAQIGAVVSTFDYVSAVSDGLKLSYERASELRWVFPALALGYAPAMFHLQYAASDYQVTLPSIIHNLEDFPEKARNRVLKDRISVLALSIIAKNHGDPFAERLVAGIPKVSSEEKTKAERAARQFEAAYKRGNIGKNSECQDSSGLLRLEPKDGDWGMLARCLRFVQQAASRAADKSAYHRCKVYKPGSWVTSDEYWLKVVGHCFNLPLK